MMFSKLCVLMGWLLAVSLLGLKDVEASCPPSLPKEVVFLVDSSNTMDRLRFYGEMLDFLIQIFTSMPGQVKGAVVTFGSDVITRIPMANYSDDEWTNQVETIRQNSSACCACCTPLAEGFQAAKAIFAANSDPNEIATRLTIVITDGAVFQLPDFKAGFFTWPSKANSAQYRYQIVPQEAQKLKKLFPDNPVRVMVIGVPSNTGLAFKNLDYFSGKFGASTLCDQRGGKRTCVKVNSPPFPIITAPANKNIFLSAAWNVTDLLGSVLPDLCEILITRSPTVRGATLTPTARVVTTQPTRAITQQPSRAQTSTPTRANTLQPTSKTPTFAPTRRVTSQPTKRPTTLSPTKKPTTTKPTVFGATLKPTAPTTITPRPTFGRDLDTRSPTTPVTASPTTPPVVTPVTASPTTPPVVTPVTASPTTPTLVTPMPSTPTIVTTKTPSVLGATPAPSTVTTTSPTLATATPTRLPTNKPSVPTLSPTAKPTGPTMPTMQPTISPTEVEIFNGLDIFIYMDRSKSMIWRADICRQAPGANPDADDAHVCWELFVRFVNSFVQKSTEMHYEGHPSFGWQDDWQNKTRGVRTWIYAFACQDKQKTPIVEKIGERISNAADFAAAMETARSLTPDGGTCPGAALERSLGMILANDLLDRPHKVGLMMTDGVFYDGQRPKTVSKGLAYLGVLTYALGISIPSNGNNFGLTKQEIRTQREQLMAFVDNHEDRFLNFGEEGYLLLDAIVQDIIDVLPADVEASLPHIIEKPYWCGWSNSGRCINTDPSTFDSSQFCKWIPSNPSKPNGSGSCVDKKWCQWKTKATCNKDANCQYVGGSCKTR